MPDDAAVDRQARVASLLEDNIRTELRVQNDATDLGLPQEAIARLAWAVTAEVLYAFSVDWSPDWVKPGQVHTWQESVDFFARCPACLQDSPAAGTPQDAAAWAASHQATHSPGSSEPGH
jgi:hypothetical protein